MSKKKIVIVGGGIAGKTIAQKIADNPQAEVVMIEPKEYLEVPYAQLRGLVDPKGFGRRIRKPYAEIIENVEHIQDTAALVDTDSVTTAGGIKASYDYLVLATGSSFKEWPLLKGSEITVADRQASLEAEAAVLEKAASVLIIGGGAVGVELAGEIATKWPEKTINLVEGSGRLLHTMSKKMSKRADKVLSGMGVSITTNARLSESDGQWRDSGGKVYEADTVYKAVGITVNSDWISGNAAVSINDRGAVKVAADLRAIGTENIFVVGDLNDVPEIKLGAFASMQAELMVKNLTKLIADPNAKLKAYKTHPPLGLITLGTKLGAVQLPIGHPHFLAGMKQKDLFVSRYVA